jgi:isoleucyl-tRNA synthetase
MKSVEEYEAHLSVLFETLFNLTLTMSPSAPFLAEFSYQRLKPALTGNDRQDSVLFSYSPDDTKHSSARLSSQRSLS